MGNIVHLFYPVQPPKPLQMSFVVGCPVVVDGNVARPEVGRNIVILYSLVASARQCSYTALENWQKTEAFQSRFRPDFTSVESFCKTTHTHVFLSSPNIQYFDGTAGCRSAPSSRAGRVRSPSANLLQPILHYCLMFVHQGGVFS